MNYSITNFSKIMHFSEKMSREKSVVLFVTKQIEGKAIESIFCVLKILDKYQFDKNEFLCKN